MKLALAISMAVLCVLSAIIWLAGSHNPVTDAGYAGYVTRGAVFGKAKFVTIQLGPTSPGRAWLLKVVNFSVTPFAIAESFDGADTVLSRDNMQLAFRVHAVFRINPERGRDFVERFATTHESSEASTVVEMAYGQYVREPLRTEARNCIQALNAMQVKEQIGEMTSRLTAWAREYCRETPFLVDNIVVGNVQYPPEVSQAVARKLSATQLLEQKATEIEIERREKEKRMIQAEGIAGAMAVINERLTGLYIQHEAIEAQKLMANSPNHTVVYIPVGAQGVPLVGAVSLER